MATILEDEKSIGSSSREYGDFFEKLVKASKSIILLSMISEKPRSGYDLIKDIFSISNVFLSQGTIYPILYAFEEEGIIEARYQKTDTRSKIYHITPAGKEFFHNMIQDFSDALQFIENIVHR
ncbi:Transcriptional regulator PadR-like family protein [uncultured archaeon]|nr:Transcriptional regulator PadR-like family protein [uncultured archaeon]